MFDFENIVIGAGLIGSAAAKYLAESNSSTLLIGPEEPLNYAQTEVFASHYDNSRVQRLVGINDAWTRLNIESQQAWLKLEEQTGRKIFTNSGTLYVAPTKDSYLTGVDNRARNFGISFQLVDSSEDLLEIAPEYNFSPEFFGYFESNQAGSINPREIVKAQKEILRKNSGTHLTKVVSDVQRYKNGWQAITSDGQVISANNVLISAGSFSNFHSLLAKKLDIQVKPEVIVLAEVTETVALSLSHLPSLLYEIYVQDFDGIYLVKPEKYEDGNWYLKMGLNQSIDQYCTQLTELQNWFMSDQHKSYLPILKRELEKLLPSVRFESLTTKPCVISRTVSDNPYIDKVDEGLYVATGCNGYSAMSSDAQGRVAAHLISAGTYPNGYSHEDFQARYLN
jgi:sarcosine oxidase